MDTKLIQIYPFIDELVESLYTNEINSIIDSENVQMDKKTFLMFIVMYFTTKLYASQENMFKDDIKLFLSDIIRTPEKRRKCIEMFLVFESGLKELTYPDFKKIKDT
jgi:hypothetical protein